MSSIRSTTAALNQGIQSTLSTSGAVLSGAATWASDFFETENEIRKVTREIDIEQRVLTRVTEFMEFESELQAKHGDEGINRINELREQFVNKAAQRKEK